MTDQQTPDPDDFTVTFTAYAPAVDPGRILDDLGAKWSPAFSRPGPFQITARDCVICRPDTDCICHTIEFGSDEYHARLDKLHGKTR